MEKTKKSKKVWKKCKKLTNACGLSPNCLGARTRTSPDTGFRKAGIKGTDETWELIIFLLLFGFFNNPNLISINTIPNNHY